MNLMMKYMIFLNPILMVPPLVYSSMKSDFFIFQPMNNIVNKPPMVIRKLDDIMSRAEKTLNPKIFNGVPSCRLSLEMTQSTNVAIAE